MKTKVELQEGLVAMDDDMKYCIVRALGYHNKDAHVLTAAQVLRAMREYRESGKDLPTEWEAWVEDLLSAHSE